MGDATAESPHAGASTGVRSRWGLRAGAPNAPSSSIIRERTGGTRRCHGHATSTPPKFSQGCDPVESVIAIPVSAIVGGGHVIACISRRGAPSIEGLHAVPVPTPQFPADAASPLARARAVRGRKAIGDTLALLHMSHKRRLGTRASCEGGAPRDDHTWENRRRSISGRRACVSVGIAAAPASASATRRLSAPRR